MALDERGASRLSTASTAEGAALQRAIGTQDRDPAVRNPDHLAIEFVGGGLRLPAFVKVPGLRRLGPRILERIVPGSLAFEVARTKHLDTVVREEVAAGIAQLVFLGAGYETRPYRLQTELAPVAIYEVDIPAMSEIKQRKIAQIVGPPPPNVTYVQIDFTREDLGERLAAHGHDTGRPTLYVWSGVAPYLPPEAVAAVLDFVGGHASPETSIVFDYLHQEVLDGERPYGAEQLMTAVEKMGEPFRFGIPRGGTAAFLAAHGLRLESDLGAAEAVPRYLTRADGSTLGPMWEFGGFAHARVAA